MEYPKFKVCCRCFTFNQAKYITDAMNGFTMQQTQFPFVCTIVDDASTDGEQEVIKKYVEENFDFSEGSDAYHKETDYAFITYAQHKTNKNCYFAVLYLKENHYSKRKPKMGYLSEWRDMCEYEAVCEGDDYWIDPIKLQKQVDHLDTHEVCILCCTNALVLWEKGSAALNYFRKDFEPHDLTVNEVISEWAMPTAGIVFRLKLSALVNQFKCNIYSGDYKLSLVALANGTIHYMPCLSVVYRKNDANLFSISTQVKHADGTNWHKSLMYLLTEYDKYTNYKYHNNIASRISKLTKLKRCKESKFWWLVYPLVVYNRLIAEIQLRLYNSLFKKVKSQK